MTSTSSCARAWRAPGLALVAGLLATTALAHTVPDPALQRARQALQGMAIPFEANSGQFDERVAFMGRTFAGAVFVTRQGQIVYSLPGPVAARASDTPHPGDSAAPQASEPGWSLTETLAGARPLSPVGGQAAETRVSRFTGPDSYQPATYRNLHLGQAWPGIEVELAARGSNVEKLFHVAPHADADQIQVRLEGAQSLRLGEGGELIATTGHGDVAYTAPVAFQESGGRRIDVPVRYALNTQGDGYGFAVGAYDRALPLVIDPLLHSAYLGGKSVDSVRAIAIAPTGEVVVGGASYSTNFPGTTGGAQPYLRGGNDGFVTRLSPDLGMVLQSTYLGGTDDDYVSALAISPSGHVVVGGATRSTNFPGTTGSVQPSMGGVYDGFITHLSADLRWQRSTYLGGSGEDQVTALAIMPSGDVMVGGTTRSTDFPGTVNGAQSAIGGASYNGFVTRLSADLHSQRSTYLGGAYSANVSALIMAPSGEVVVGGYTANPNLKGRAGGAQPSYGGNGDGFVARLSADLGSVLQSTYLGGEDLDRVSVLAMEPSGDVVVGGRTLSVQYPVTASVVQPDIASHYDGFITRLSGDLTQRKQSTYLGGPTDDSITGLAIAPSGHVIVSGYTSAMTFPGTAGGLQPVKGYFQDGFVSRLSADLGTLQSTYWGGSGSDEIAALAIASTGEVVITGTTLSENFPGTVSGSKPSPSRDDGFISRLTNDLRNTLYPQSIRLPSHAESGLPVSYASTTPGTCTVSGSTVTVTNAGNCAVVINHAGNAP